jgi:hypothetical protein
VLARLLAFDERAGAAGRDVLTYPFQVDLVLLAPEGKCPHAPRVTSTDDDGTASSILTPSLANRGGEERL